LCEVQSTFAPAMQSQNTIVAISTPHGEGAIGIIRLSGREALNICSKHVSSKVLEQPANQSSFYRFKIGESTLDEVVLTVFRAPHSYTGEDICEISFHGSSFILNQAMEALIASGANLASPGEFTQRAFLNGKMDLSQAEAVADLIASESEAEHRLAMNQMRGGFSQEINRLREELINFASLIELELDFSEEDVEFANRDELQALIEKIQGFVTKLIESFRLGNAVKNGIPIAIIGKPNAGKSTLLNALLNEDKAIVSEIAGTTRDAIEDVVNINGIRFRFIDTAGIRETDDIIESIGVKRSYEKMLSASAVLYLFDIAESSEEHIKSIEMIREKLSSNTRLLVVGNKSDRCKNAHQVDVLISAKTGEGLDELKDALGSLIEIGNLGKGDTVVTNTRHLEALKATNNALESSLTALSSGLSGDLVAADIREALHHLGSITGSISADDLLGNIFGKFCIGK
jgi:tRNA modification GTPase